MMKICVKCYQPVVEGKCLSCGAAAFSYKVLSSRSGYAHCEYEIERTGGDWPITSEDLISIVDNGNGTIIKRHFGGTVRRHSKTRATVKVYID